jgi:predicted extracellular nuclease
MKKLFLISLVGLAICLLAIPAAADTQKLLNGGFENWSINGVNGPPDNWFYRSIYPTVTADSTIVMSGTYSAKYTWTSSSGTMKLASDTIAVTPGAVYTCTLWVYDNDVNGKVRPWFWFIPNGLSPSPNIPYSEDSAGWKAIVWTATCPAGSYQLNMEVRGNVQTFTVPPAIYLDNMVLWEAIPTANTPPVISSVLRYPYPLVPGGATVTSKATITDDHTIVTDSLYRRVVPGAFAPVYHDSIATGGNYWYTLGSYNVGDSVEYYVIAVDDSSARTASATYGFTVVDTSTPPVAIAAIQFNNTNPGGTPPDTCYPSNYLNSLVKINGIVTGVFQRATSRFYLQDADSAWSGIYVYGSTPVAIGDSVTIVATDTEYYGLTELMRPSVTIHSSGHATPAPIIITADMIGDGCSPSAEQYEEVLCKINNFTVIADSNTSSGRYSYWGTDGSGDTCAIWMDVVRSGSSIPTITVGQTYNITGIVHYTYGQYRLAPRNAGDVVPAAVPPQINSVTISPSPVVPGQVVIATANITDDDPITDDSLYYALNAGAYTAVTHDSINGNNYKYHMGPYAIGDSVSYYVVAKDIAARTQSPTSYFIVPDTSFCGADTIYNIEYTLNQGTDTSCFISPYEGQIVNICGIVTSVQQGSSKYFYLQDPRTTAGYAGWTGITVYDYIDAAGDTFNGAIGDKVELNGRVKEYYGWTEIDSLIDFTIRSTNNPLPETTDVRIVDLIGGCNFGAEPYENVLVKIDSVTVLSQKDTYSYWITDNSTPDSIYMQSYNWYYGPDQPAVPPSTGARYLTLVGVIKFEGRYQAPYVRSYVLMPRKGSDYVPLVVPQANIVYAFPIDQTHLAVQFDRAMQQASAETPSHYTTTSGLSITAAALDTDRRRVILTTAAQTDGLGDTLIVVGVTDSLGVTMIIPDSTRIWQGFTPISTVQAPNAGGDTSAILGDVVTVKGVIVADTTSTLYNNLIINDASNHGCVLAPWTRAAVGWMPIIGDTVIVTGSVIEYYSETELSNFATYRNAVLVNHGPAPQPTRMSSNTADFYFRQPRAGLETYEDVFSKLCDSLVVLDPSLPTPTDSCQLLVSLTSGDTISLITKVRYHHYTDPVVGDTIVGITGIFRWHFNYWRLEPRSDADFNTGLDCGGGPACEYLIGDISGDGQRMGGDVTYGVRYFKGVGPVPRDSCYMDSTGTYLYVAGDVNGNCEFRGSDVTRLVGYFKGTAQLSCCHWFPTTLPPILRPSNQGDILKNSTLKD